MRPLDLPAVLPCAERLVQPGAGHFALRVQHRIVLEDRLTTFGERAWATSQRAAVDAVASDVVARLRQAGVRAVLLKGASFADWLYPNGARMYVDVDLLVRPDRAPAAEALLRELGYSQLWAPEDM